MQKHIQKKISFILCALSTPIATYAMQPDAFKVLKNLLIEKKEIEKKIQENPNLEQAKKRLKTIEKINLLPLQEKYEFAHYLSQQVPTGKIPQEICETLTNMIEEKTALTKRKSKIPLYLPELQKRLNILKKVTEDFPLVKQYKFAHFLNHQPFMTNKIIKGALLNDYYTHFLEDLEKKKEKTTRTETMSVPTPPTTPTDMSGF